MKIEFGERYQHTPDPELNKLARRLGGLNPYGEPNYRLVWGWSRMDWMGGEWNEFTSLGTFLRRNVFIEYRPKYHGALDYFHLERWGAPTESPESWRRRTLESFGAQAIETLGGYPVYGDYESIFIFRDDAKGFVWPNSTIVELRIQEHKRKWRANIANKGEIEAAYDKKKLKSKEAIREVYDEALDEFRTPPMVGYSGKETYG